MTQAIDWLERLRRREALLDGHFRLSSGLHSPHYVQCARLLEWPEDAESAGRAVAERLRPLLASDPAAVVSPAIGGIVLGHEVARAFGSRAIWAERADEQRLTFRRGFALEPDESVVAVEDVVTTATSLWELLERVRESGARVVGVAALVDRSGGTIDWKEPFVTLAAIGGVQVPPEECPQCAAGVPVVKPGSRPE